MYRRFGKRCLDIVAATSLLLMLSPLIVLAALFVRWRLGSPVLFVQDRAGKDGRVFQLNKFRSMTDGRDAAGQLLPDSERLTAAGRMVRSTSLDELPQLWNVIRGDMSLIGPRPLLVDYLKHYNQHQARRHEVRPGITGWAQVNGRNDIDWESRFNLDVHYVDHHNALLDAKILAMTVLRVFQRSGVSSQNHATMERFQGTPPPSDSAE